MNILNYTKIRYLSSRTSEYCDLVINMKSKFRKIYKDYYQYYAIFYIFIRVAQNGTKIEIAVCL